MMDVFEMRIKGFDFGGGWDAWHLTKWILIAFLIADKLAWEIPTYKDAGLTFMWLTIIVVGLHTLILHVIFKE